MVSIVLIKFLTGKGETVNELVTALLNAQTATSPVTITLTLTQIQGVIWTDGANGFPNAGTLKGDPDNPADTNKDNFNNMRNRFAPGGGLGGISLGDYLYIVNHGFVVVGWGPFLGTISGIAYALNNTLASQWSSSNPIPYIADFCYGTNGTGDGTGWLQDPRPRPFYSAATQVYESWLRSDQVAYLKKRSVPALSATPIAVYDNFIAYNNNWQFFKIPDTIDLATLPLARLYFKG